MALTIGLAPGCLPKKVAVPELPEVSRARRQRTRVRCVGTPELLDCAAATAIDTERGWRFDARDRWRSRPDDWGLSATAPVARHPAMAAAYAHRSCRFEPDGCLHRLRVPLVPERQRGVRFSGQVAMDEVEGFRQERRRGREEVDLSLRSRPLETSPGGPLGMVAWRVGGRVVVGRVGWEAFAPAFLGHALTLEGETGGELRMAYVAQVTTDRVLVLPSLGLGLGLPVQVAPRLTSGLRLQATLAFPYVGLVTWMDLLDDREPVRAYIGGQLSL